MRNYNFFRVPSRRIILLDLNYFPVELGDFTLYLSFYLFRTLGTFNVLGSVYWDRIEMQSNFGKLLWLNVLHVYGRFV